MYYASNHPDYELIHDPLYLGDADQTPPPKHLLEIAKEHLRAIRIPRSDGSVTPGYVRRYSDHWRSVTVIWPTLLGNMTKDVPYDRFFETNPELLA